MKSAPLPHFLTYFLFLLLMVGCSISSNDEGKIAYISANQNSQYEKTFKELKLGILYDFNLKLTKADQSWVTIWVEGYQNGEKTDPFRLLELSYGLYPNKDVEGPMGFGIMNPQSPNALFFLYSPGASVPPHEVDGVLNSDGVEGSHWGYAIGNEEVGLKSGETLVLGVYREARDALRTYDYQDPDDIAKMIQDDEKVLLLKMKVEMGDHPQ